MLKIILTAMCCAAYLSGWAQFSISGTVNDASGPLAGATVQTDRGNYFAITNDQGEFRLSNLSSGEYLLLFRFLGFKEKQEHLTIDESKTLTITLEEDTRLTDEVTVYATRAAEKSPTTFTNINKKELAKQNFGQDLPFVLNYTPSLVTTSDAGAGIGYTGLRIRGSDATRINVTINGIPYNDSESQGVFWVNIPDIATSTQSVQIQRGVGTSTNGPGAFGASINLQTNTKNETPYVDVINSVGSFKTHRHTVGLGTGMINDRFSFDARASFINSDGFIDRASSSLKSYYASGGYYGENTIIKAIAFGGHEVTYQSWYGVPESRLNNDVAGMMSTAAAEGWNAQQTDNLLNANSRTFNIYDYKNQVDNYTQDNFQLHFSHKASSSVTANMSFHYTPGKGYYEEFKYDQTLADYGLSDVVIGAETITETDLVRKRWLDNDFYGITYSINYDKDRYNSVLGGAWNKYDGDHFGEITWAEVALSAPKDFRYYYSNGDKKDFNVFWKSNYEITNKLVGYLDLQFRKVDYKSEGIDDDLTVFSVGENYNFFNPKIGLTYQLSRGSQLYSSYAIGQREPVRSDFINAVSGVDPKPEVLSNVEAGWRIKRSNYSFNLNYYLMSYKDQLVLTGELNDVGASIRTNVDDSYRTGVELEGALRVSSKVTLGANVTLSENKIKNFTEVIYDYGVAYDEYNEIQNQLKDVDISFSPSIIAGSSLSYNPFKNLEASLLSKYVGEQYLDNTSNQNRKIEAYFINDLRLSYSPFIKGLKDFSLSLLASNIFDETYESNGYTWGFVGGGETVRQNYYYPQAGRNYLLMLSLKF
ncbi:MAG: TonB-dependent receptor [Cyclobacteriaceae bacterium]|nr:TonB-dependent receptor [Cyclobacteriaceae bacterium]